MQNGFFQHEDREAKRRNFDLLLAKRRINHLKYTFLFIFTTFSVFKHKIYILLHITLFIISKLFQTGFDYRRYRLFYRFSSIAEN